MMYSFPWLDSPACDYLLSDLSPLLQIVITLQLTTQPHSVPKYVSKRQTLQFTNMDISIRFVGVLKLPH